MAKEFDLWEHEQKVLKTLMTKEYRNYVKDRKINVMNQSAGEFKIEVTTTHEDSTD